MSNFICLDSSVVIKFLTWEEDSEKAVKLFENILDSHKTIVLPNFAWSEIGSVLRKKIRSGSISIDEGNELWQSFIDLGIIQYIHNTEIMKMAWNICNIENLPTLYDAAYIATAKLHTTGESICEFWTADERLINSVTENKALVKNLKDY